MAIHFVGFKPGDPCRMAGAVRVWGQPDFVHPYWDARAYEDFDRSIDTMVISNPVHHNPKRSLPRSGVKTITVPECYGERYEQAHNETKPDSPRRAVATTSGQTQRQVLQAPPAHPEEKLMFIELHLQADGDPVLVNTNRIVSALAHVSGGTLINLDGTNIMYITVRETYQDIINVLYSRGMT